MANALKCDRCGSYFDYDPSAKNNFIAFGHKDIIVGRNFPVKDICPTCMDLFMKWFENPYNWKPEDCLINVDDTDVGQSFIEDVSKVEDILPDKIIPDEPYNSVEDLEDPCDSCLFTQSQKNCEQCRYGYISLEDRKKRYAKDKEEEE